MSRHIRRVHGEPEAVAPRPSLVSRAWEGVTDTVFGVWIFIGAPVVLFGFWVAVSYVVMVLGWLVGVGELHAFPELLLVPGSEDCWPYHDGPC